MQKNKSHLVSFINALTGVKTAISSERHLRFHFFSAVAVAIGGFSIGVSHLEWVGLVLAITLVVTAEILNTSIEAVVDIISPEYSDLAKIAKDTAAGAVLICAVGSIVVGLLVFGPRVF